MSHHPFYFKNLNSDLFFTEETQLVLQYIFFLKAKNYKFLIINDFDSFLFLILAKNHYVKFGLLFERSKIT